SDIMLRTKFRGEKSWEDIVNGVCSSIRIAKESGAMTVGVNAEDGSRTALGRLMEYALAVKEAGADRFRYSDTIGAEDPITIFEKIRELACATKYPVEMHCHNDLGMAVAASLAGAQGATEAGVDCFIDTTINGYGERAGNCDLVSTILAIKFSHGFKEKLRLDEHVDLSRAWKVARYASYAFNIPIPITQPGVGANAFAHESGIHADGTLKDSRTYELYAPEDVGRGEPERLETGRIITTGEYGGIKGFRHVFSKLGIEFHDDKEARNIFELVQFANLHTQKPLTDDELGLIARHPEIVRNILKVFP
ncbi:MAG: homocitrate synthase, partial [Dissulfurispiraceae bacterium]